MNIKKIWELPILSAQLEEEPQIVIKDMNIIIILNHMNKKTTMRFDSVLCHKHTSERFTESLLDAYDVVVEIDGSSWLDELKEMNERDFDFWKPRHFAIYLDGLGLYQFIARDFITEV